MSQFASNKPLACSSYASTNSSKVTFRYSGLSTDGEIDKVLLVGPIAPHTYFLIPVFKKYSSHAFLAIKF